MKIDFLRVGFRIQVRVKAHTRCINSLPSKRKRGGLTLDATRRESSTNVYPA